MLWRIDYDNCYRDVTTRCGACMSDHRYLFRLWFVFIASRHGRYLFECRAHTKSRDTSVAWKLPPDNPQTPAPYARYKFHVTLVRVRADTYSGNGSNRNSRNGNDGSNNGNSLSRDAERGERITAAEMSHEVSTDDDISEWDA